MERILATIGKEIPPRASRSPAFPPCARFSRSRYIFIENEKIGPYARRGLKEWRVLSGEPSRKSPKSFFMVPRWWAVNFIPDVGFDDLHDRPRVSPESCPESCRREREGERERERAERAADQLKARRSPARWRRLRKRARRIGGQGRGKLRETMKGFAERRNETTGS